MRNVLLILILLVTLVIHGYFYFTRTQSAKSPDSSLAVQEKAYPLLSKRVLQEFPNDILIKFLPLRRELRETVAPYGETFAFYFEYLPTGVSIGINEKVEFSAASLFKVPVVMGYYHYKERKGIDEDPVVTIAESQVDKNFGNLWKKGAGTKINLKEAVKLSLTESDNTAIQVIAGNMDLQDLENVYNGLDLELMVENDTALVTAKNYVSVLKALFFSSLLTKEHSEEILEYMTKSKFQDKLVAGVPKNIPVAHKIGIFNYQVFMDCGIVYLPRRQYALCMVSVSDEDEARRRMVDISKRVYQFVSAAE